MKKVLGLAMAMIVSQQSFAYNIECVGQNGAEVKVLTTAFETADASGPADVKIKGLGKFDITTSKALHLNTGAFPMIYVPLKSKKAGQLLIVFMDEQAQKASVQHVDIHDEYTVLAEVSCQKLN